MNYGLQISEYDSGLIFGYYGGKFLPFHMGHLNCIIQAASMVDVLFVVVGYDDLYDKKLCKSSKFNWIPASMRERWISKAVKDIPNVRVLSHYERRSDDFMTDPFVKEANNTLAKKLGGKIDVVFSSELEYEAYFSKYFPTSKHVLLDNFRIQFNISATQIREKGVFECWDMLPKAVQEYYTKRICLCGVESTGKSTMTKLLAAFFQTNFVEEYGRTYYDDINSCFDIITKEDFYQIAAGHTYLINQAIPNANKLLFIDTEQVYTQFFRIQSFDEKCLVLDQMIKNNVNKIDTYIYLEPHNEYELDGSRLPVNDVIRKQNNDTLIKLFNDYNIELHIVDEKCKIKRMQKCIEIVKNSLSII